jgi:hypothetical protein
MGSVAVPSVAFPNVAFAAVPLVTSFAFGDFGFLESEPAEDCITIVLLDKLEKLQN